MLFDNITSKIVAQATVKDEQLSDMQDLQKVVYQQKTEPTIQPSKQRLTQILKSVKQLKADVMVQKLQLLTIQKYDPYTKIYEQIIKQFDWIADVAQS